MSQYQKPQFLWLDLSLLQNSEKSVTFDYFPPFSNTIPVFFDDLSPFSWHSINLEGEKWNRNHNQITFARVSIFFSPVSNTLFWINWKVCEFLSENLGFNTSQLNKYAKFTRRLEICLPFERVFKTTIVIFSYLLLMFTVCNAS